MQVHGRLPERKYNQRHDSPLSSSGFYCTRTASCIHSFIHKTCISPGGFPAICMFGAGVGFGPFFMQSQAASGAEQCLPAGLIRTALSSSKYEVLVWQPMHYVSTYVPIDQMRVYKSAGGRNDPPYPSHSRGGGGTNTNGQIVVVCCRGDGQPIITPGFSMT